MKTCLFILLSFMALRPVSLDETADGRIELCYEKDGTSWVVSTGDGGNSWSSPKAKKTVHGNSVLALGDGSLLRSVQLENGIGVEVSKDGGSLWAPACGTIRLSEKIYDGKNRPRLVPYKDGRIALVMSTHGYEWLYKSVSHDCGKSWSAPEPWVYSPFQGSCVTVLPDGKWLLVKNGKIDERLFYVPDKLYAFLSDDEGETWYGGLRLDDRIDAAEPVVCVTGDGTIYIAYAFMPEDGHAAEIKLVRTDEAEIAGSLLTDAARAADVKMAVDANSEARSRYDKWFRKVTSSNGSWARQTLRMASYNIEFVSDKAGVPKWEKRLDYVDWLFRKYDFDVVGVQEPWENEYQDLSKRLGDRWDSIRACVSLDSPNFNNIIFWKRDRVRKLDDGVFWYTENPGERGGFGGLAARLCIWAKFRDRKTGKIFFVFNSHYDFINTETALISSRLLLRKVREIAGKYPAVCTGDYNCSDSSSAIQWIVNSGFMADSKVLAETSRYAELSTVRRYKKEIAKGVDQIDHLFFTVGKSKVKSWQLLIDEHDGLYGGSDHIPICVEWLISN